MKDQRLFKASYTLNFAGTLLIFLISVYWIFSERVSPTFFITVNIILLCTFPVFDWLCHQLLHAVKTETFISKRSASAGIFFKNICLLLSLLLGPLFLAGIFNVDKYADVEFYVLLFAVGTVSSTGIYLYIAYGKMTTQLDSNFSEEIENFGEEE